MLKILHKYRSAIHIWASWSINVDQRPKYEPASVLIKRGFEFGCCSAGQYLHAYFDVSVIRDVWRKPIYIHGETWCLVWYCHMTNLTTCTMLYCRSREETCEMDEVEVCQQLLRQLKSVVEGLLASQLTNVWQVYGGLNRLHNVIFQIFRHGCKSFNHQVYHVYYLS